METSAELAMVLEDQGVGSQKPVLVDSLRAESRGGILEDTLKLLSDQGLIFRAP